ncbi:MAG: transaldolase family protein [Pseudomonadota bacterium]
MTARGLRFFVDSADPDIWRLHEKRGWLYGATTNPLILQRAGLPVKIDTAQKLASAASEIGLSELQFQSWGEETDQLIGNGREIAGLWENMTVKIPATRNGLEAAGELKRSNIRITLTACYTAHQTALAAAMNLDYVAPYYGRMLESGMDADSRLGAMLKVSQQNPQLRILVASIRNVAQLETLLANGLDTFTISPDLCAMIGLDEHSDMAAADFENAARQSIKNQH